MFLFQQICKLREKVIILSVFSFDFSLGKINIAVKRRNDKILNKVSKSFSVIFSLKFIFCFMEFKDCVGECGVLYTIKTENFSCY